MKRRHFLGALAATAAAPLTATAEAPPDHVRFSHVAYGLRPDDRLGSFVEWRGLDWWVAEGYRLRWADPRRGMTTDEDMARNFIELRHPIWQIAPDRDRLWLLTPAGWYYFTYACTPVDDSAHITFAYAT